LKRSFGKKVALTLWFIGSCGAVVFIGWVIFAMAYTRKVNLGALSLLALGILGAWQGFKMYHDERRSK
jgi:hypothetical protein